VPIEPAPAGPSVDPATTELNKDELNPLTELCHFGRVAVDGVKTGFTFQAEDEDDRIHPSGEL
jgi:hypothetical protein